MYYPALKMQMSTLMMLVLSPIIGTTTSIFYLPFCIAYAKMALPLTHFNVNGLSKKQLAWLLAYSLWFKALEEEN
jgi:hypothetical protein